MNYTEEKPRKRIFRKATFRKLGSYAFLLVIAALILLLISGQIYQKSYTNIKTEIAYKMSISNYIETQCYAIRDENVVVSNDISDVKNYVVSDGTKVSKGSVIINLFDSSEQALLQQEINNLENQIKEIEALQANNIGYNSNTNILNSQIEDDVSNLIINIKSENFYKCDELKNNLLYSISKYNIAAGKESDFEGRISQMSAELNSLRERYAGEKGRVYAPESGYFINRVDGFEECLTTENILQMTTHDLQNALKQKANASDLNTAGKIVGEFKWYLVCVLDQSQVLSVKKGSTMEITLPYTSVKNLPVKITAINKDKETNDSLVVMECDYMSSELANIRNNDMYIHVSNPVGIKISTKAIRTETIENEFEYANGETVEGATVVPGETYKAATEVKYVYVVLNSKIEKRYIKVIYEDINSDIALCQLNVIDESGRKYLGIYDEVVVEGGNLYDGKII